MEKEEHSSLWFELAKRKQPTILIDLPVFDDKGVPLCKVLIRTLVQDDNIAIQKAASSECDRSFAEDKTVDKNGKIYVDRYENIAVKHYLFRAIRDPDNVDRPFFPTPDHVSKALSNDEIAILLKHYQTLQDEKGPLIAYMDSDRLNEWVEKLASDSETRGYFLDRILPEAQIQLITYMAKQLLSYQTDKSLLGLPASESTSETETSQ